MTKRDKDEEKEDVNFCICELLWLVNLANDIRISNKIRCEINNVVTFMYKNKDKLLTDESLDFIDSLSKKCENLGSMRYQNDLTLNQRLSYIVR